MTTIEPGSVWGKTPGPPPPVLTRGVAYWEGDVTVPGNIGGSPVSGVGYTEVNPPSGP